MHLALRMDEEQKPLKGSVIPRQSWFSAIDGVQVKLNGKRLTNTEQLMLKQEGEFEPAWLNTQTGFTEKALKKVAAGLFERGLLQRRRTKDAEATVYRFIYWVKR